MPVTATATINENPDDQFYEAMVVTGVISQMGRPVGPGVIRALVDGFAAPCGAAEVHGDGSYTMKTRQAGPGPKYAHCALGTTVSFFFYHQPNGAGVRAAETTAVQAAGVTVQLDLTLPG